MRQLLTQAKVVAIGNVGSVTAGPGGDTQVATVTLTDVLAGAPTPTLTLAGRVDDPEGVFAGAGDRLLLIVRPAAPGGPASHEVVSPVGGLVHLSTATEPPARALLAAALANGGDVPLAAVLGGDPNPPAVLLNAALADLATRVGSADGPVIGSVACAPPGEHQRQVRLWALEQVGRTRSAEGTACARTLVRGVFPTRSNPAGGDAMAALSALRGLADDPSSLTTATLNTVVKQGVRFFPFGSEKCAGEVSPLLTQATISLITMGDARALSTLYKAAVKRPLRAVASTAVHGLRLIGGARAVRYLGRLAQHHPDLRIRQQALESLAAVGG